MLYWGSHPPVLLHTNGHVTRNTVGGLFEFANGNRISVLGDEVENHLKTGDNAREVTTR